MVAQKGETVNITLDPLMAARADAHGWEFRAERAERRLAQAELDLDQAQAALVACGERARKAVNERDTLRALVCDMGEYRFISRALDPLTGGHVLNMPACVWHRFVAYLNRVAKEKAGRT